MSVDVTAYVTTPTYIYIYVYIYIYNGSLDVWCASRCR